MKRDSLGKVGRLATRVAFPLILLFLLLAMGLFITALKTESVLPRIDELWNGLYLGEQMGIALGGLSLLILLLALWIYQLRPGTQIRTSAVQLLLFAILLLADAFLWVQILTPESRTTLFRVVLIMVLTGMPASLYALFLSTKIRNLWPEFWRNVEALDPTARHDAGLKDLYRSKFVSVYGNASGVYSDVAQPGAGSGEFRSEIAFPVFLATIIIGLGWILCFAPVPASEHIFTIDNTPFTFGFLGAYIFTLEVLFRRYVQGDLKSTAYSHVSQRILLTWVWAFLLTVLPSQVLGIDSSLGYILGLAFAVGVLPDVAWQVLGKFLKAVLGRVSRTIGETHSLGKIDGITIWTEARLMEEGIENVENLVTANIFDLLLRTNLPACRIVDWIDQGILELHLGRSSQENDTAEQKQLREALQTRGVVKATDLLELLNAAQKAGVRPPGLGELLDPIALSLIEVIKKDPDTLYIDNWCKSMVANPRVPDTSMEAPETPSPQPPH